MKKYSALSLLFSCSLLLGACQSNQSQAPASSSTEQSSSQAQTKQTQSTSSTASSSSQVESSKASSSSSTEQSSSQSETKENSSETKELDYDQLYVETLTKIKADPDNKVSHYAFYDIDGNGTKELLTGISSNNEQAQAVAIYYLKNGVSTYLAHSEVQPVGGGRAAFSINSDGTVTQLQWLSQNGEGMQTTYKLVADNSGASVIEEKPFKVGQDIPADTGLDLTNFDWQPLSVPAVIPEVAPVATKEMDLDAIRAGDYSSLYGTWAKPNGETIVFDASSFGTGNGQISYVKDIKNTLMFSNGIPTSGVSFIPKGVEYGDSDTSRDRYNPINVSSGYVHESTYYRVD